MDNLTFYGSEWPSVEELDERRRAIQSVVNTMFDEPTNLLPLDAWFIEDEDTDVEEYDGCLLDVFEEPVGENRYI